jgi:putative peptidoglycan lipid II flippase
LTAAKNNLLTRTQGMGAAALALGAGVLLSRVMGLVRDKIIAYYFGTSAEADIYFAAFTVPDFLNYLMAGG